MSESGSGAWINNYSILYDVITYPSPRYPFLSTSFSYHLTLYCLFQGFQFDFYVDSGNSTDIPQHVGVAFLLPVNLQGTSGLKNVPINGLRNRPVGQLAGRELTQIWSSGACFTNSFTINIQIREKFNSFHFIPGHHVITNFNICYDNWAKFCSDPFVRIWMRAKQSVRWIWSVMEKIFCEAGHFTFPWRFNLEHVWWKKSLWSRSLYFFM